MEFNKLYKLVNEEMSQGLPPMDQQAQPEVDSHHELTELEISKRILSELTALSKISRGGQCGSLTNRIYYRISKLRDMAKQLYTMHQQYER